MLEIENLHVAVAGKKILDGLTLKVGDGEVAAIMGPNGSGKSTLSYVVAGRAGLRGASTAPSASTAPTSSKTARPARRARPVPGVQYPLEIPGVATMTFLKAALNATRKARGEAELPTIDFMKRVRAAAQKLNISQDMLSARSTSAFPAARRSAWKSCKWRCWSRVSPFSTKWIPASTSTPCESAPKASTPCAQKTAACW